ncbi:MAG: M1 family metallopeptidase [Longimicrobiaceae bacterium]
MTANGRRLRRLPLQAALLGATVGCVPPPGRPEPRAPDYSLAVRVLPAERRLDVTGTLRLPPADTAREALRLWLSERMVDLRVEILGPAGSAGPAKLERASGDARPGRVAGERRNAEWILRPSHAIPPREPVLLRFSYEGSGEVDFLHYVGPEVAFASGWGDYWYPVVEGASGSATGELTVQVPAGWKAITGGARRGTAEEEARGTFRSAQLLPTCFTFVAGPYTVARRAGGVPLSAWLLKPRDHIDAWLAGVAAMQGVLGAEFGPYPFEELALVEVPRDIAIRAGFNAFSPAGFLVLNSRAFDVPDIKYLHEWLGHEMAHQWFPHAVTWDPPGFLYLEEALAEYGGQRVVEELAGPEAARRQRTSGFEYDPIYSAAAWFRLVGAGVDQPLAGMGPGIDQRNLAYNKGSLVFDMLSREIGRAGFRRILHDVTRGRRMHTITWREFLEAVSAGSGRNLDWFFEQWLTRAGAPDFQLSWTQQGDLVRGTITQAAPWYRAHLEVELRGSGGERIVHVVEITGASAAFTVAPGFRAVEAVLDPDYKVLRWTPEYRALADSVRAARRAPP